MRPRAAARALPEVFIHRYICGMEIRRASDLDQNAIWRIIGPVIRVGETYALDRNLSRDAALNYWLGKDL